MRACFVQNTKTNAKENIFDAVVKCIDFLPSTILQLNLEPYCLVVKNINLCKCNKPVKISVVILNPTLYLLPLRIHELNGLA